MSFKERYKAPATPPGDILVWELEIPAEVEGALVAVCDGYEGRMQLRSKMDGRAGSFAAWAAPDFRDDVEALLAYFERRHGVKSFGPRPFTEKDLAAGMHLAPGRGGSKE